MEFNSTIYTGRIQRPTILYSQTEIIINRENIPLFHEDRVQLVKLIIGPFLQCCITLAITDLSDHMYVMK